MENKTAEHPWRWRDAGIAALIWFVPATGLINGGGSIDRALASIIVGLMVGTVISLPLPSTQAQVAKTATARRVLEAVWTAAAAASALALLGLDDRTLISAVLSLAFLWIALAVSTGLRPLAVAGGSTRSDAPTWLPVSQRSAAAERGKRAFDVIVAGAALIAIAPVLAIVAVAIKAKDGGPVFFRQRRVGRNGIPFEMLKFRSMVMNAEELKADLEQHSDRSGPLFKMTNDPRITPVGRIIRELSIDELPQLINILRGDMSLVGPRPALPNEAALFDQTLQRRTLVSPGLTGLWQAEARSDADFNRFRNLDLRYVSSASPSMDFWIILATATELAVAVVRTVLRGLGVDTDRTDGVAETIDLRVISGESTTTSSVA